MITHSSLSPLSTKPDNTVVATLSFTNIELNRIENLHKEEGEIDISGMASVVNSILRAGLDNLNASPLTTWIERIDIPSIGAISLSDAMKNSPELSITPSTINPPTVKLRSAAILVDKDTVRIMADINVDGMPDRKLIKPITGIDQLETDKAHIQLSERYQEEWTNSFGKSGKDSSIFVVLSKKRLSELLNFTWTSVADLKVRYSLNKEEFPLETTELRLTDKPTMNCRNVRSCSRRTCPAESTCERERCTRRTCDEGCSRRSCDLNCGLDSGDCSRDCGTEICAFGGCVSGPNDPVCLAAVEACKLAAKIHLDCRARELGCNVNADKDYAACKVREAACNVDADADYAACQVKSGANYTACIGKIKACNVDADLDYGTCETTQELERGGCNIAREWQNWAGDVGKISGTATASGGAVIQMNKLEVSSDFSQVTFEPHLSGKVDVSGKLKFTPYDIGHVLVCPWSGTVDYATKIAFPAQSPEINAQISVLSPDVPSDNNELAPLELEIKIDKISTALKTDTPPWKAILEQNPRAMLSCSPAIAPHLLTFVTVTGEGFKLAPQHIKKMLSKADDFFQGKFTVSVPSQSYRIPIKPIERTLPNGQLWRLQPIWSEKAIVFTLSKQ